MPPGPIVPSKRATFAFFGDSVQINSPWLCDHLDTWLVWSETNSTRFFFCWRIQVDDSNCTLQQTQKRWRCFGTKQTIESSNGKLLKREISSFKRGRMLWFSNGMLGTCSWPAPVAKMLHMELLLSQHYSLQRGKELLCWWQPFKHDMTWEQFNESNQKTDEGFRKCMELVEIFYLHI